MARIPIGLELYSVRHDLEKDARATLKAVASMGYEGVEYAGPPKHDFKEIRKMLDEFKIVCCGWHVPFDMMQDDKLAETIELSRTLGNTRLIVPWIPEELRKTRAGWLEVAKFFDSLVDKLKPHGMAPGYHNHHFEFSQLEGEVQWDIFFGATRKEVIMQLDTGNALHGGGLSVPVLKRYPGRAKSVHLKPYSSKLANQGEHASFRPVIGEDEIPWAEVFRLCEMIGGTEWYVVEYESDAYPPLEAVECCLKALKKMGK